MRSEAPCLLLAEIRPPFMAGSLKVYVASGAEHLLRYPAPMKVNSYERKAYIVSVLALVVSIIGLFLGFYGTKASWQIAEASGSFEKAMVEVSVGGYALSAGKENFILVGADQVAREGLPVIGALPITLRSAGQRSVESLLISFQYHQLFRRDLLEGLEPRIAGVLTGDLSKRTSSDADRFFVSYTMPVLHPGMSLKVAELSSWWRQRFATRFLFELEMAQT
jgi:hypothetical protein